jgi:uncharacterized protein (DUF2252 family)
MSAPEIRARAAQGRAARKATPRSAHAEWEPPAGRRPAVETVLAEEADRLPELLPLRHSRMLASPFTFFRGAAAVMAGDLAGTPTTDVRVQLCGDAHVSNFGGFASPDRRMVFDINDFDETAEGPWEWDVKRLAASVAIAGRDIGLPERRRRDAVRATVRAYREAIRDFAGMGNLEVWYARLDADLILAKLERERHAKRAKAVRKGVERAQGKDSLRALSKLCERDNGSLRIASRPPLLVPIEELLPGERGEDTVEQMRKLLARYARSLRSDRRRLLESYRYVHMARKVVGVGSVGTRAWVVLLAARDGRDPLFLQVKEAGRSVLESYAGRDHTRNHGQRVVQGQWLMQAASDIFLGWLRAPAADQRDRDFYVRQLWDWKASADVGSMSAWGLTTYGRLCGWTLARAHARSGDRVAIAGYLGSGDAFDRALTTFAETYADQNERDFAALTEAARTGKLTLEGAVDG